MWHMIRDMLHMEGDMWHVTHRGCGKLSHNFSSLALTVWELWYLKIWRKRITQWLNWSVTKLFVEQPWLHWVCKICSNQWRKFGLTYYKLDGVGTLRTDPSPTSSTSRSRSLSPQVTDSSQSLMDFLQSHDGFFTDPQQEKADSVTDLIN